jgi:hypothetical protein
VTKQSFRKLRKGDHIRNLGSGNCYVIVACTRESGFPQYLVRRELTATNPSEWERIHHAENIK